MAIVFTDKVNIIDYRKPKINELLFHFNSEHIIKIITKSVAHHGVY